MIFTWQLKTIATSLFTRFPLIMTFPEFDSLFKNLVSHVAISLGTCPITSKSSVKLTIEDIDTCIQLSASFYVLLRKEDIYNRITPELYFRTKF